jgi:hypothetical protein
MSDACRSTLHERPSDIPPLWRDYRVPPAALTPPAPGHLGLSAPLKRATPLPQLQRVGMLETPVLQTFRWRPPEIVAKTVDEVASRFNKLQ